MTYEVNDDIYPSTSVVYIESTWGNDTFIGSGVLVGRNDVLTASHIVYDGARGGLADRITVYVSFDPDDSHNVSYLAKFAEYYTTFDPDGDGLVSKGDNRVGSYTDAEVDIALISLSEAAGDTYGWFGIDILHRHT